jgi:hypothetical protein
VLGTAVRACEKRTFPIQRDRTDSAFDGIVLSSIAAIIDEARQARPARERITDGFGELALLTNQIELCVQPPFECLGKWPAFLLANEATLLGAAAAASTTPCTNCGASAMVFEALRAWRRNVIPGKIATTMTNVYFRGTQNSNIP